MSNVRRLKGDDMLEMLRGKRLVFVGDSLNRNMWESLACVLRNSLEDKSRMLAASDEGEILQPEGSDSIIFKVYQMLFPHYILNEIFMSDDMLTTMHQIISRISSDHLSEKVGLVLTIYQRKKKRVVL